MRLDDIAVLAGATRGAVLDEFPDEMCKNVWELKPKLRLQNTQALETGYIRHVAYLVDFGQETPPTQQGAHVIEAYLNG